MTNPDLASRFARAKFRAWHRGTREADFMIGGFFDAHHADWDELQLCWFESLLEHEDVDIMGWALGTIPSPPSMEGAQMSAFRELDYVSAPGVSQPTSSAS